MHDDPLYGRVAPELGWVPAPSYALRRHRVLALLDRLGDLERGPALEVGCGAGALLADLARQGFAPEALESSPEAVQIARSLTADLPAVAIHAAPPADSGAWDHRFSLLVALEVLEHIEDDRRALARWAGWLVPGARLLLSVPAHPERWNASDVWAGHFRRYRRRELEEKLEAAGLEVERIESWGVPLANLIHPVRTRAHARALATLADDDEAGAEPAASERDQRAAGTARSGVERSREMRLYPLQASWPGRLAMRAFLGLQRLFLSTDLGNGYLALARRAEPGAADGGGR